MEIVRNGIESNATGQTGSRLLVATGSLVQTKWRRHEPLYIGFEANPIGTGVS